VLELRDRLGAIPGDGAGAGAPGDRRRPCSCRRATRLVALGFRAEEPTPPWPTRPVISRRGAGALRLKGLRRGLTRPRAPEDAGREDELDVSLRPQRLGEFVGQDTAKQQLGIFLQAALQRGEALDPRAARRPAGARQDLAGRIVAAEMGSASTSPADRCSSARAIWRRC